MKSKYLVPISMWVLLAKAAANLTLGQPQDVDGHAIAVWVETHEGRGIVQTSTYDHSIHNWSLPHRLSSPFHSATNPSVSKDPYGDAVVVWEENSGGNSYIEAAFFSSSTNRWSEPVLLSNPEKHATHAQVSKDVSGIAIAVWESNDSVHHRVEASVYDPNFGQWSKPFQISQSHTHAFDPQVSVDAKGDGVALFRRANGSESIIQSANYTRSSQSWSPALDVSTSGNFATTPQIGTDASGRAFAVVHPTDGANYTVTLHATKAQAVEAEPITVEKEVTKEVPVYIYASSTTTSSQTQSQAITADMPSVPTNVKAWWDKNIFPLQIEYYARVSWGAPDDESITGYNLYLNGELLESFEASEPRLYEIHNIDVDATYLFEVASFNAEGIESAKVLVSLF